MFSRRQKWLLWTVWSYPIDPLVSYSVNFCCVRSAFIKAILGSKGRVLFFCYIIDMSNYIMLKQFFSQLSFSFISDAAMYKWLSMLNSLFTKTLAFATHSTLLLWHWKKVARKTDPSKNWDRTVSKHESSSSNWPSLSMLSPRKTVQLCVEPDCNNHRSII